ncbi:MAG TPA: ABC transporter permease [Acidimicrobiales bacterium]|nr:ABC transporter permease [Acidimicrobiales bacterium]
MRRSFLGSLGAVLTIAGVQLRRVVRDRTALVFTLVLPLAIILVVGSAFGGDQAFKVGVIDRDGTAASRALVAALDRNGALKVEHYGSLNSLRPDVRLNSVAAGVIIPAGYGADLARGDRTSVTLMADPTSGASAAVQAAVRGSVSDQAVVLAAARASGGRDEAASTAARLARTLPQPGVRAVAVNGGDATDLGVFDFTAPANLTLFVFVNTLVVGTFLASERRQGIIRRMLATPHGTGTIVAGVGLGRYVFALAQAAVIVVAGSVLFGVSWGNPLGAALVVLLFAAVATAVGLLVGAMATDPDQASTIVTPVAIGLAMLGGCMWPLEVVPPFMRAIGHLTPHAWAMDAWGDLIFGGDGVVQILPQLAVLAGFAAALGLLAAWRLRKALTS